MNFVGGFREGEIDGEPFHIYTSSGEVAIDSGGSDDDLLFICQSFRSSDEWENRRENDPNAKNFLPVDIYPHFYNKTSDEHQFRFAVGSDIYDHTCKLPLVPLFWCNNEESNEEEFICGVCKDSWLGTDYLFCVTCGYKFHKECIESPLEIKHPSYPFTSLKLYYPPEVHTLNCFCCQRSIEEMLYYCPTYKVVIHPVCAMKPIPIVIDYPKRHLHPLTFFPKQNSLVCDVCGLVKEHFPTYVCARCVFVVHQDCVYSPNVIKISRHHHRISFTYSLLSGKWFCGVCRREVDNDHGAYSCNKCDDYFVHTRCALREDLCDGEELEGVPEEPEIVVEPPFKRISDGTILHFSHEHLLKLEIIGVYDEGKICQACVLPIYEGSYYLCMDQCEFILHEACANEPRKKLHALHAHALTLNVVTNEYDDADGGKGHFYCDACCRESCGFVYENVTEEWDFRLDLRCASVSEPFEYGGHEHPLFLALTPEEEESSICQICQEKGDEINDRKKLTCIGCDYIICFKCATLPYKARYKHDKHFLTFQEKEKVSDHPGWCDICERKMVFSRKGGFYSCDDYCSTTVHVKCLLGEDPYMKHGQTIKIYGEEVEILQNSTMSRPHCYVGKERCSQKVVFKIRNEACCSLYCVDKDTF